MNHILMIVYCLRQVRWIIRWCLLMIYHLGQQKTLWIKLRYVERFALISEDKCLMKNYILLKYFFPFFFFARKYFIKFVIKNYIIWNVFFLKSVYNHFRAIMIRKSSRYYQRIYWKNVFIHHLECSRTIISSNKKNLRSDIVRKF